MSRTILITGGCGFIGSNFVRYARHCHPDWQLVNLDALSYSGNAANLADLSGQKRYQFVHGDINDRPLVDRLMARADAVIHFAAESHVDRSIVDATPFVRTNVMGTQVLVDSLRAAQEKTGRPIRLVHISTDEVYGSLSLDDPPDRMFTENTPLNPNSPYAASKAASDMLVRAAHHTFGLDTIIARCSNNFGPYQFPEKIIPLFVTNLLQGRKVPLYGNGQNVRDWLHVEDHCQAILTVLLKGQSGRVYNIGANNQQSNLKLTRLILQIMGKDDSWIEHVPDRPGHDLRYAVDATRITRELGWQPTRSAWPDALEQTVRWYVDNRDWWEPLRTGT